MRHLASEISSYCKPKSQSTFSADLYVENRSTVAWELDLLANAQSRVKPLHKGAAAEQWGASTIRRTTGEASMVETAREAPVLLDHTDRIAAGSCPGSQHQRLVLSGIVRRLEEQTTANCHHTTRSG